MYHSDLIGGLAAKLAGSNKIFWNIRQANIDVDSHKRNVIWIAKACAKLSPWLPGNIICCSHAAQEFHLALGYSKKKMLVIPNGFDLDAFQPDKDARKSVRKELGLDENVNEEAKKSFQLSKLTFDIVSDLFGGVKPGHGVAFPTASDQNIIVFDEERFNEWKKYTMQKFGDVTVHLFPKETAYIKQVKIEDEKFDTAKTASVQGKAAWLEKEREAGRSID
jgi:glycosyltransferase involved in cell wall biosynthesis